MDIGYRLGFAKFTITELEGKAKVEDLKKMRSFPALDFVDIEANSRIPTGVHGLNERYYFDYAHIYGSILVLESAFFF